jgi:hypothetical protein
MLFTDQPLATITNPAYKEKMFQFDPSFIVPDDDIDLGTVKLKIR